MVTEMNSKLCYFPPAQIFKANEVTKLPWTVCLLSLPGPQVLSFQTLPFQFPAMQQAEVYYMFV